MKKFSIIIMSFLLVFILGFSTIVSAAPAPSSQTPITALSKDIINKANQGDVQAQNQINSYFSTLSDAAKNGDPTAINKLKNLDCFNQIKEKEHFANLKLAPGKTIKYYFDDGSAIEISSSSINTTNGTLSAAETGTTIHAVKTWFVGLSYAKITTYVNITSIRTVCHINDQWGVGFVAGGTMTPVVTSIVTQDGNPSAVQSSSMWTIPNPVSSATLLVKYHVDTAGAMTEYFAS